MALRNDYCFVLIPVFSDVTKTILLKKASSNVDSSTFKTWQLHQNHSIPVQMYRALFGTKLKTYTEHLVELITETGTKLLVLYITLV